jgi:Fe-S-cluster-containing hydrogenase component 2
MEAISEKGDKHWIDPEVCSDCGACVDCCPIEAISAE